jgi:agmatine deiminase
MQMPTRHSSSKLLTITKPATLGYRMPAEWESHAATWLAWPHFQGDWPGKFEPIPWVYAEMIRNLARHERVDLIVSDRRAEGKARKTLARANALSPSVRFHRWPTNRVWLRDSGCIFLTTGGPGLARPETRRRSSPPKDQAGLDFSGADEPTVKQPSAPKVLALALKWRFNGWAKYSNWRHDEKIGGRMAKVADAQEIRPVSSDKRIVLEGGAIDVNGAGTLLTTEECLLSKVQERNPGMTRVHYEKAFADYLGATSVIWLGRGIFGDDTHGHVDDLARFVSADTVITMVEPNAKDVNHAPLRANLRRLQAARDQNGKQLTIAELPMPGAVVLEGRRLPASYANFYIANGAVLVPVFNHVNDRVALNTLSQLFPQREIIPIYCGDLVWGLGTLHCMTQQQPCAEVSRSKA